MYTSGHSLCIKLLHWPQSTCMYPCLRSLTPPCSTMKQFKYADWLNGRSLLTFQLNPTHSYPAITDMFRVEAFTVTANAFWSSRTSLYCSLYAVRAGQPLRPYPRVMPCDERNGYFELSVTNVVTVISSLSNMTSRSANWWHPWRVPASFFHLVRRVRFCYETFPLFRVFPRLWITADPEWRKLLVSRRAFESSTPPSRSDFTVISCIFRFH